MPWADNNYLRKKRITVSGALVSGALTNFPVVFDITDNALKSCRSDGYDIKFYNSSQTLQLKHERVAFDNSTGALEAWIKLPKISGSGTDPVTAESFSGNTFWIYYSSASESTDQQDATNVWDSNYRAVYHLQEASGDFIDSTVYHVSSAASGNGIATPVLNRAVDGQVGNCIELGGANGQTRLLSYSSSKYELGGNDNFTLEAWINPDKNNVDYSYVAIGYTLLSVGQEGTAQALTFRCHDGSPIKQQSDYSIVADTWQYVAVAFSDTPDGTFYADGVQYDTDAAGNSSGKNPFEIGHGVIDSEAYFSGNIDEVRYSNIERSQEWLHTCYQNQYSSAKFLRLGTERVGPQITNAPTSGTLNIGLTSGTATGKVTMGSGNVWIYWGNNDGGIDRTSWDTSGNIGLKYYDTDPYFTSSLSQLSGSPLANTTTYYYRCYLSSNNWRMGDDWAPSSAYFTTTGEVPVAPVWQLTYDMTMSGNSCRIDRWCSRWDVQDYNIILETWVKKNELQDLRNSITPGAVGELYNILGRSFYVDKTWTGDNTLQIIPHPSSQLYKMRRGQSTVCYPKNLTTSTIEGDDGWLFVKIEGAISGSGDL